jgi:hypothetical protein
MVLATLVGMQIRQGFSAFVLVFMVCILRLSAQTPDTAVIRGTALDPSRAAVAGAEVTVTNNRTGMQHVLQTDGAGNFVVAGLSILGDYDVSVHKLGFALAETKGVTLIGGAAASLNFQLAPAAEKTEITVTGAEGTVRTDMPQLGDLLGLGKSKKHRFSTIALPICLCSMPPIVPPSIRATSS